MDMEKETPVPWLREWGPTSNPLTNPRLAPVQVVRPRALTAVTRQRVFRKRVARGEPQSRASNFRAELADGQAARRDIQANSAGHPPGRLDAPRPRDDEGPPLLRAGSPGPPCRESDPSSVRHVGGRIDLPRRAAGTTGAGADGLAAPYLADRVRFGSERQGPTPSAGRRRGIQARPAPVAAVRGFHRPSRDPTGGFPPRRRGRRRRAGSRGEGA